MPAAAAAAAAALAAEAKGGCPAAAAPNVSLLGLAAGGSGGRAVPVSADRTRNRDECQISVNEQVCTAQKLEYRDILLSWLALWQTAELSCAAACACARSFTIAVGCQTLATKHARPEQVADQLQHTVALSLQASEDAHHTTLHSTAQYIMQLPTAHFCSSTPHT
jgi:hypothetical protein